jgi:hypothetical protein
LTVRILTGWRLLGNDARLPGRHASSGLREPAGFLASAGGVGKSWSAVVDPGQA